MTNLYREALAELAAVCKHLDDRAVDDTVRLIAKANTIIVHGCGRERLQVMGFAMRLHHLGLKVAIAGDMTVPPAGPGDLFIATVGPGELSTVSALLAIARDAGAETLAITAQPEGRSVKLARHVLTIPAQTMANDRGPKTSVLPMGSVFEGALFVVFEVMVLKLRDLLGVTPEKMRAG
ncbi:MAG: SIS domain-containing protein, partial [Rhizobiales bacterium]|nr:SIS domain-containing protein [Hyphomicrobiales bacterium]